MLKHLSNPHYIAVLFLTWFVGVGVGYNFTFLFWHLQVCVKSIDEIKILISVNMRSTIVWNVFNDSNSADLSNPVNPFRLQITSLLGSQRS